MSRLLIRVALIVGGFCITLSAVALFTGSFIPSRTAIVSAHNANQSPYTYYQILVDLNRNFEHVLVFPEPYQNYIATTVDGQFWTLIRLSDRDNNGSTDETQLVALALSSREFKSIGTYDGLINGAHWITDDTLLFAVNTTIYVYSGIENRVHELFHADENIVIWLYDSESDLVLIQTETRFYRMNVDGTNAVLLAENVSNESYFNPSWDYQQIALVQEGVIRIIDSTTGEIIQTIESVEDVVRLQWSPDNRWLTVFSGASFSSLPPSINNLNDEENARYAYNVELETGDIHLLYTAEDEELPLQRVERVVWSPDSSQIAYEILTKRGLLLQYVYVADPNGANRVAMGNASRLGGWSPDGRYFWYGDVTTTGQHHVFIIDWTHENGQVQEIDTSVYSTVWYGDNTLIFTRPNIGSGIPTGRGSPIMYDVETSTEHSLTSTEHNVLYVIILD